MRNSPAKTAGGQFSHLTGQLDPGGPGPDHHDGQPALLLDGVGDQLGHFEGAEDAAPELEGVIEGLHPRSEEGELVVPEVGLGDAGGDDQAVVGILDGHPVRPPWRGPPCARGRSRSPRPVAPARSSPDARRVEGQGRSGLAPACRSPSGRGGVGRDDDCDGRSTSRRPASPQEAGGREAPEPPADDDHPMAAPGGTGRGRNRVRRSSGPGSSTAPHNPGLLCMMPPSAKMVVAVR